MDLPSSWWAAFGPSDAPADATWEEFHLRDDRVVRGYYVPERQVIMVLAGSMSAEVRVDLADIIRRTATAAPAAPPPKKDRPRQPQPPVAVQPPAVQPATAAPDQPGQTRAALTNLIESYTTMLAKAREDAATAATQRDDLVAQIDAGEQRVAAVEADNAIDEQFGGYQWNERTQSWIVLNKRNNDVRRLLADSRAAIAQARRRAASLSADADRLARKVDGLDSKLQSFQDRLDALPAAPAEPTNLLGDDAATRPAR